MKTNLTTKQKKFADLYIETGDRQKSYLKAYPKAKPCSAAAAATRLLKNVKLKRYIDIRQEQIDSEVLKHQIFTKKQILQEETRIISANIKEIYDENGEIKELHDWPESIRAAIKDFKFGSIRVGTDDHGNAIYKKYLKQLTFHDKGSALNRLEKCYGMHQENKQENKNDSGIMLIKAILAKIDGQNRGKLPQEE
jgi:phage terminase small subunit